ncbi:MAG TPA: acetyl-CoA carboxylase biotin carboxylase subunit [Candidatus Acutalibacter pullistercoris]|uniref:biotin carboxylase n=1 Tax=Candidatus Acutalibacter pullistercoris TaxID=2838418 RepID=A0A9D2BZJ0_9FIRM|nr:acetyl-CoA carboxylase biotin carboxylase subunit [Candidatus Acutalibacter pullistercoris]
MFTKILIANRGEIAIRIIRACKEMGISTVAVYSEADRESLHVALADQAICIGGPKAEDSYLNGPRILSAAMYTGAQAIHPGYGFLAENRDFADQCQRMGIKFIGPGAEIIAKMGDKDAARRLMKENGVPTTPGTDILRDSQEALKAAEEIGYPVLLKASAGGGGKGIRLVEQPQDMERAFETASSEALKAFGDGRMYLEKYLHPVKHIEVQLLADEAGHIVCLGERECSIQKNNQKLIEESPSPGVSPETRQKLMETATRAARAAGYVNAGTVEFLMDKNGDFYFMEMNTRLQVEHPVSELVTGVDIVKWQIRIAAGVELDFTQEDIHVQGAAIECRINALGPGKVDFFHTPGGPWVRFDTFLYQGYEIPPYYDSMLGKMIVYSSTREEAIRKMLSALSELVVDGAKNNIETQIEIIRDKRFKNGDYYTDFMKDFGKR